MKHSTLPGRPMRRGYLLSEQGLGGVVALMAAAATAITLVTVNHVDAHRPKHTAVASASQTPR